MAELAAIALGSNLGDRGAMLKLARDLIGSLPATRIVRVSPEEDTAPIGPQPQAAYLNQMLLIETELEPRQLLDSLLGIERVAGRERGARWGPRTLDCDIVLFGRRRVSEPGLTIPHPELMRRDFWLRELKDIDVELPAV